MARWSICVINSTTSAVPCHGYGARLPVPWELSSRSSINYYYHGFMGTFQMANRCNIIHNVSRYKIKDCLMHTLKIHLERMFDNIGIEMAATYDPYAWVSWNSFVPGILRTNSNSRDEELKMASRHQLQPSNSLGLVSNVFIMGSHLCGISINLALITH